MGEPEPKRRLSALDLLFDEPSRAADELAALVRDRGLVDALPDGAPRLGAAATRLMLGSVVQTLDSLLDSFGVDAMLTGAWSDVEQVRRALTTTREDGGTRNVELLRHRVSVRHAPRVDLLVNEVPLSLLELVLEASFVLAGCDLVVRAGEIVEVGPGHAAVETALRTGDVTVLEHRIGRLDLGEVFRNGPSAQMVGNESDAATNMKLNSL
jgi:hypothetical protein